MSAPDDPGPLNEAQGSIIIDLLEKILETLGELVEALDNRDDE